MLSYNIIHMHVVLLVLVDITSAILQPSYRTSPAMLIIDTIVDINVAFNRHTCWLYTSQEV
jgi:hypothetical protein